jgi:hypothetical protein
MIKEVRFFPPVDKIKKEVKLGFIKRWQKASENKY